MLLFSSCEISEPMSIMRIVCACADLSKSWILQVINFARHRIHMITISNWVLSIYWVKLWNLWYYHRIGLHQMSSNVTKIHTTLTEKGTGGLWILWGVQCQMGVWCFMELPNHQRSRNFADSAYFLRITICWPLRKWCSVKTARLPHSSGNCRYC